MKVNIVGNNYNKSNLSMTKKAKAVSFSGGRALYAGSFDPITNGHLDLVKEASNIFDRLIILVARNSKKQGFLPFEKRVELIEQSIDGLKNVSVDTFEGLTVDYAKAHDVKYLLRGMRSGTDFDNEMQISNINRLLNPDIRTVVLFSSPDNNAISSSVVREIFANHGDFSRFVPKPVAEYLNKLLRGVKI